MKIIYKQGNLLDCEEEMLVHGANALGVMGAGVALAIKQRYPAAYKFYKKLHQQGKLNLGSVAWIDCGDKMIIHAITQENYGRENKQYCSYSGIREAFNTINMMYEDGEISFWGPTLAMPKIGAGLAGGDWDIIEKIIEEECTDVQPVVYYL